MKTLLIAIITSVCWLAPSYGQNSEKSAKEVWEAFKANQATCISSLTDWQTQTIHKSTDAT